MFSKNRTKCVYLNLEKKDISCNKMFKNLEQKSDEHVFPYFSCSSLCNKAQQFLELCYS